MSKLNCVTKACGAFLLWAMAAIALPAQTFTSLHSFDLTDGATPDAGLVQGTDGKLYGTTYYGSSGCGRAGCGTVFTITTAGALTTLHSLDGPQGYHPYAGLVQGTDAMFYGAMDYGGANGGGTVLSITAGGTLTTLYSFCSQTNCTDGGGPLAGLVQATNGKFYGTTDGGGANDICRYVFGCGTVFSVTTAGVLTTLYSFCSQGGASCTDGYEPSAALVQGADGNFYGTTFTGGLTIFDECPEGCGTVFKITPSGVFTTLHTFEYTDGELPRAGLVQATSGKLYGTTRDGGLNGRARGTVFSITTSGTLTTLHDFDFKDGENPEGALVQATDGKLYGTTNVGGANGVGTVFSITASGMLTTLHSFDGTDGSNPYAGLIQATNGTFYGTTFYGGVSSNCGALTGCGTVFSITASGTLTTLHSFDKTDGKNPEAGLAQATNGDFYGTTLEGGANDEGTVFRITASGTLTTLLSFDATDGAYPYAGLVQATNGNFYGTTGEGGANGYGTVFKITPSGVLTTLYSFDGTDGGYPMAGLVLGTDGNFYGTTEKGGANDEGTIFSISPGGTLTTLHSFDVTDGFGPNGLVQDTNGTFYGTTYEGGANNDGTVFSLSVGLSPFVKTQPTSGPVGGTIKILATDLTGATGVTFSGTPAVFTVVSKTLITTTVPTGATSGTVQVITPDGKGSSNVPFRVLP